MGLFGRRKPPKSTADVIELILPAGSSVSMREFAPLLASWAGIREGAALPAGMVWSGPRATDTKRGEPPGGWVWQMAHAPAAPTVAAVPSLATTDWEAAFELAAWLFDRGGEDPQAAHPYALAAVTGLARRTGGLVRMPGQVPGAPSEPPATWSVYTHDIPDPAKVALALAGEWAVPVTRTTSAGGAPVWEAADGRGAWLDQVAVEPDWSDLPGPLDVPFAALAKFGPEFWVVRVEGAEDLADPRTAAGLAAGALAVAARVGGGALAVDPEGFPVQGGGQYPALPGEQE